MYRAVVDSDTEDEKKVPSEMVGTIYLRFKTINAYYEPVEPRKDEQEIEFSKGKPRPSDRICNWLQNSLNETGFLISKSFSICFGEVTQVDMIYRKFTYKGHVYDKLVVKMGEMISFQKIEEEDALNEREWVIYEKSITQIQYESMINFLSFYKSSKYNFMGHCCRCAGCFGQRGFVFKPKKYNQRTNELKPTKFKIMVTEWFETELIACILIYIGIFDPEDINPARSTPRSLYKHIERTRIFTSFTSNSI
jgi:hypothetical protein